MGQRRYGSGHLKECIIDPRTNIGIFVLDAARLLPVNCEQYSYNLGRFVVHCAAHAPRRQALWWPSANQAGQQGASVQTQPSMHEMYSAEKDNEPLEHWGLGLGTATVP